MAEQHPQVAHVRSILSCQFPLTHCLLHTGSSVCLCAVRVGVCVLLGNAQTLIDLNGATSPGAVVAAVNAYTYENFNPSATGEALNQVHTSMLLQVQSKKETGRDLAGKGGGPRCCSVVLGREGTWLACTFSEHAWFCGDEFLSCVMRCGGALRDACKSRSPPPHTPCQVAMSRLNTPMFQSPTLSSPPSPLRSSSGQRAADGCACRCRRHHGW